MEEHPLGVQMHLRGQVDGRVRPAGGEDEVAPDQVDRHFGVVVLHIQQVIVPQGVIHRHMEKGEGGIGRLGVDHDGRPRGGCGVAVTSPVDEHVFQAALLAPKFHPVAGVVGHDAVTDGGVGRLAVQAIAVVVGGQHAFQQDGPGGRLDAEAVGPVVGAVAAVAALVVVAAVTQLGTPDGDLLPAAVFAGRAAQGAKTGVGDAAVLEREVGHILDVHPELVQVMDVEVTEDQMGRRSAHDGDALAEAQVGRCRVVGDFQVLQAQVLHPGQVEGGEQIVLPGQHWIGSVGLTADGDPGVGPAGRRADDVALVVAEDVGTWQKHQGVARLQALSPRGRVLPGRVAGAGVGVVARGGHIVHAPRRARDGGGRARRGRHR